jgi:citrate synthase
MLIKLIKIDRMTVPCCTSENKEAAMSAMMNRAIGLDGVVAAETALSHVDGLEGRLVIAGEDVENLSQTATLETVACRLWAIADGQSRAQSDIGAARTAAYSLVPALLQAAQGMAPIDGLRLGFALLKPASGLAPEILAVGAAPVFAAALARATQGLAALAPDPSLLHAADALRMLSGETPSPSSVRALNAYLVTVSDHSMNASTFAARVTASTQAGMFASITAAYCALTGPLHGGAPGPVLDQLDAIGTEANIASWLAHALEKGERLMGFGHRVYRVRDPRADALRSALLALDPQNARLVFAQKVERAALAELKRRKQDRPLDTNVEFYTALLLEALNIPRALFTPMFAVGRVAGWSAHVLEHARNGRLIRPDARYVGTLPQRAA